MKVVTGGGSMFTATHLRKDNCISQTDIYLGQQVIPVVIFHHADGAQDPPDLTGGP